MIRGGITRGAAGTPLRRRLVEPVLELVGRRAGLVLLVRVVAAVVRVVQLVRHPSYCYQPVYDGSTSYVT